ncbi:hypothetical protein A2740_00255 [Candidatus Nomurabacteria bacterium RIFCSPHIGHO2_01_FULL_43_16]|nr:MAG: hypothetical protein A2740_00255 [Candidatus Nomurabacteria bacterium RIFCSPHIGHO2_01_FULL_43_16]
MERGACFNTEGEEENVRKDGGEKEGGGENERGDGGENEGGGVKDGVGEKGCGDVTGGIETVGAGAGLMMGEITGLITGAATGAGLEAATGFCTACAGGTIPCIGITVLNASLKSSSLHPPPPINAPRISSRVLPLANSARMYDISSGVIINFF